MPIVPLRPLLEASQAYGFAHGAFNVNTAAQAQAVIEIQYLPLCRNSARCRSCKCIYGRPC